MSNIPVERELLRTILLGRDFEKWYIRNTTRKILYVDGNTNIHEYPNALKWLRPHKNKLEQRRECKRGVIPWFSLQWPREKLKLDFTPKILVQRTRNQRLKTRIVATVDDVGFFGMESIIFLTPNNNIYSVYYVVAILNSSLVNYLYQTKFLNVSVKNAYLKKTPIPKISYTEQQAIGKIVTQILDTKKTNPSANVSALEAEIDQLVYHLYGLTAEEIAIVEGEDKS